MYSRQCSHFAFSSFARFSCGVPLDNAVYQVQTERSILDRKVMCVATT